MGDRKEDKSILNKELCIITTREEAINRFHTNINLAYKLANQYSKYYISKKEEIYQEALLGLWLACSRFDDSRGISFSSYAIPTIQGTILKYLRDDTTVKIPRLTRSISSLLREYNITYPFDKESIELLVSTGKVTKRQLEEYKILTTVSLDSTIDLDESDVSYLELISDNYIFENEYSEEEIILIIDHLLRYIPSHKDIIEEYLYSRLEGSKLTQDMLADKYNVSKSYISRILASAINTFRVHREEILKYIGLS